MVLDNFSFMVNIEETGEPSMDLFVLSISGGLGAITRYVIGQAIMIRYPAPPFPTAILIVNILGALGLGIFYGVYFHSIPIHAYEEPWFLILGIGFFGSFTTFSTFSMEVIDLLYKKLFRKVGWYIGLSLIGSTIMFSLGFGLGLLGR